MSKGTEDGLRCAHVTYVKAEPRDPSLDLASHLSAAAVISRSQEGNIRYLPFISLDVVYLCGPLGLPRPPDFSSTLPPTHAYPPRQTTPTAEHPRPPWQLSAE